MLEKEATKSPFGQTPSAQKPTTGNNVC